MDSRVRLSPIIEISVVTGIYHRSSPESPRPSSLRLSRVSKVRVVREVTTVSKFVKLSRVCRVAVLIDRFNLFVGQQGRFDN
jgi:hypothetical protein